ncbi:FixH family protein [Pseudomonas sp. LRF_L74]|uniref:FixH family protein n=1 Tax=Pseudomonas sp. LRF_L74 TaxID=3369422 RepID=UPI003F64043E
MIAPTQARRWYKEPWVWFILGLLGFSVVQGVSLLVFANQNPPKLISDNYYDVGKGINTSLERENLATALQLQASLTIDNDSGVVSLRLSGKSQPQQLVLNLESPTQPERDRRVVLQAIGQSQYTGSLPDKVEGRRFVELIGQENGRDWRLFEEEQVSEGTPVLLGD